MVSCLETLTQLSFHGGLGDSMLYRRMWIIYLHLYGDFIFRTVDTEKAYFCEEFFKVLILVIARGINLKE